MGQPSSRSMEDTVLFPEEIPPVSPTRNIFKIHRKRKAHQSHVSVTAAAYGDSEELND